MIKHRGPIGLAFWVIALFLPAPGSAQCPEAFWTLFPTTGAPADVVVDGSIAWVGAQGGVLRVDLSTIDSGVPTQRKLTDTEGLASTDITALAVDGFGNVWVGTRENGVSVFDPEGNHIQDLRAFEQLLYGDLVLSISAFGGTTFESATGTVVGDRVIVASADEFSAAEDPVPEGGGLGVIEYRPNESPRFRLAAFPNLERGQEVLATDQGVWVGTAGVGLWRREETAVPPPPVQVFDGLTDALLSANVTALEWAPSFEHGGTEVLWIGSEAGLQRYDGTSIDTVAAFTNLEVFDLEARGNSLYVVAEGAPNDELYSIDLSVATLPTLVSRADCFANSGFTPRSVGVGSDGTVVLATIDDGVAAFDGSDWICPPPVGPHWGGIGDLVFADDGRLFFGTGDKELKVGRGIGIFDGTDWEVLRDGLLDANVTELATWPDGTLWLGTTRDAQVGGLQNYDPDTGVLLDYHDDAPESPAGLVQGRNVWGIETDASNDLWVVYGQVGGGLTVIDWPTRDIENYDIATIFPGTTDLLRDVAFDSQGRAWITTADTALKPGHLFFLDTKGTHSNRNDDSFRAWNMQQEIADIGEVLAILVDDADRVWIAGKEGLVRGTVLSDGSVPVMSFTQINGTSAQNGGRRPQFNAAEIDWNGNLWFGTVEDGALRMTSDTSVWSWFDLNEGCPIPDRSVTGILIDESSRSVYLGTATQGIVRVDLNLITGPATGLLARPFPNPWRPGLDGSLSFAGIPAEELTTIRIYNVAGELVFEGPDLRGATRVWDGRNQGNQLVEAGVYVVTAIGDDGRVYEGKVAVLR